MAWRFESGIPLTLQIRDKLRADILSGVYKSAYPFPTVRQLAADAAVNPNTMQKALSMLEEEGLLITLRTAGRIVTDDESVLDEARRKVTEELVKRIVLEAKSLNINYGELSEALGKEWCENE